MEHKMKTVFKHKKIAVGFLIICAFAVVSCTKDNKESTIKVGILHSLTGTMAISEIPLRNAELLAIQEENARGGILGRQIEVIEEDGESAPQVFAYKMQKLLEEDKVSTVFGCWTSASRKAVKPVVEKDYPCSMKAWRQVPTSCTQVRLQTSR